MMTNEQMGSFIEKHGNITVKVSAVEGTQIARLALTLRDLGVYISQEASTCGFTMYNACVRTTMKIHELEKRESIPYAEFSEICKKYQLEDVQFSISLNGGIQFIGSLAMMTGVPLNLKELDVNLESGIDKVIDSMVTALDTIEAGAGHRYFGKMRNIKKEIGDNVITFPHRKAYDIQ
jgi:hypothetical protein